jgi:hypothetical protein
VGAVVSTVTNFGFYIRRGNLLTRSATVIFSRQTPCSTLVGMFKGSSWKWGYSCQLVNELHENNWRKLWEPNETSNKMVKLAAALASSLLPNFDVTHMGTTTSGLQQLRADNRTFKFQTNQCRRLQSLERLTGWARPSATSAEMNGLERSSQGCSNVLAVPLRHISTKV